MSEKPLRYIFIFGTVLCLAVLGALSLDSLGQVVGTRTPPMTAQVDQGKQVWQSKNCNDCHTILGIGGYFAPDLTKVVDQRGPDWIRQYLKDPASVYTNATMPNQRLSAAEIENLTAFFVWVNGINTNAWPPKPVANLAASGAKPSGAWLFQQKGCASCHMVNGQGAAGPGPDLTHIATQPYAGLPNTPEALHEYVENPKLLNPTAMMPALPLSNEERDAIVEYMVGLR